ncbi:MAG: M28 family peptidase [candidate division WOR-3 bacterium]
MINLLLLTLPSVDSIKANVYFLASEKCEGRFTGSKGEKIAREYIKKKLRSYGYKVGEQGFRVLVKLEAGKGTFFKIGKSEFQLNKDFLPLSFSSEGKVKGEVVFAGWGIDDSTYSDYQNLDVKDKIVLLFRYSKEDSANRFESFADIPTKLRIAREKGAKGVILVNPPDYEDELRPIRVNEFQNSGILAVMVKREVAERILGRDIKTLYDSLKLKYMSFNTGKTVEMGVKFKKLYKKSANVYAVLNGKRGKWIIFGAHYDHLGWGGIGSGSLKPDTNAIHPGADDNASGVSLVLEAARVMSKNKPNVGYIFVFFSGEELGLLGSKEFVKHLPVPKESVIVYLNFDMVGRLRDSAFSVLGAKSGEGFDELVERVAQKNGFKIALGEGAVGPSDHTSFYLAGIPVAFFFTGTHEDYHKPSDTPDKINYEGIREILKIALEIADSLGNRGYMKYVRVKEEYEGRRTARLKVKLGIIPAYGAPVEGVQVDGVVPGGVAETSGIKAGDIIVSIGGKTIKNLYDYMDVMSRYNPGDRTVIVVRRSGEFVEIPVEFPK